MTPATRRTRPSVDVRRRPRGASTKSWRLRTDEERRPEVGYRQQRAGQNSFWPTLCEFVSPDPLEGSSQVSARSAARCLRPTPTPPQSCRKTGTTARSWPRGSGAGATVARGRRRPPHRGRLRRTRPSPGRTPVQLGAAWLPLARPARGLPGSRVRPEPGSIDLSDVEVLIGYAQPCQCHGHSSSCDRETGICHVSTYACWGICN